MANFVVTPKQVIPLPHGERNINPTDRRRGKTAILTSTPYKNELEESINSRANKKPKLNLDRGIETTKGKKKLTKGKKKVSKRMIKKKVQVRKPTRNKESSSEEEDETDDAVCFYCNDLYSNSKSGEGWITCQQCRKWAHEECAGVESDECEEFCCEFCK